MTRHVLQRFGAWGVNSDPALPSRFLYSSRLGHGNGVGVYHDSIHLSRCLIQQLLKVGDWDRIGILLVGTIHPAALS